MRAASLFVVPAALALAGCPEEPPKFDGPRTLGGVEVSAEVLNRGHRLYEVTCARCHGLDGSGQGPNSLGLVETPRDFRTAQFRYKSTPGDALPTDADLDVILRKGKIDGGMPAWPAMPQADRTAIIHYIKTFSPRWESKTAEAS